MKSLPRPLLRSPREWLRLPERHLRLVALLAAVAILALGFFLRDSLAFASTEALGYPTVFLIALVGNAVVFFPVPAIFAVCSGGVVLTPLLVGLVAGVAMALGELTGYLAGIGGSGLAQKSRFYRRAQPWMRRWGWAVVMAFATFPNPLFDVVGVAAGASRVPLWQFLGAAWAGKTAMAIMVAYGCDLGYSLFRGFLQGAG